ncbi:MAG: agmatine deiminase family protein [Ignavibacteriales bacterium]|nr:agmatine deiminase family protein [Ignavibacteriales bacterium]
MSNIDIRYTMPAEWEKHEATWLGWPHNLSDWPGKFAPIPWVYAEIVGKICSGEKVRILVESKSHEASARRILSRSGVDTQNVECFRIPTDRGWTRDSGPMFNLSNNKEATIVRFHFNAWAKYPNWKKDAQVPPRVAKLLQKKMIDARQHDRPVVLEGGSIDVNGNGSLITTEECLLDPKVQVRNPGFTRNDYAQVFKEFFGITNVLWLEKGIAGDDTHGHVDDFCRFVKKDTIVLCSEKNSNDSNYRPLKENRERLEEMKLEDGSKVQLVELPMPAPVVFDGQRLPASYANFYIANAAVIVPTFNDPNDRITLGILSELITDRPVVGIHALDLVWGLGTLHCLTQQQPLQS